MFRIFLKAILLYVRKVYHFIFNKLILSICAESTHTLQATYSYGCLISSQWNYRIGSNAPPRERRIGAESMNLVCEVRGSQFPLYGFIGEYGGEIRLVKKNSNGCDGFQTRVSPSRSIRNLRSL